MGHLLATELSVHMPWYQSQLYSMRTLLTSEELSLIFVSLV